MRKMIFDVKCDIDGKEGTQGYDIQWDGERWSVDLCEEHSEQLQAMVRSGRRTTGGPKASRGSRQSRSTYDQMVKGMPPPVEDD